LNESLGWLNAPKKNKRARASLLMMARLARGKPARKGNGRVGVACGLFAFSKQLFKRLHD
jgi:hypothetical protein